MRKILFTALFILFLLPVSVLAAVNINTADATLLDTLPGIGPSKAAAIIDYRTTHGPFTRIEDIQEVKGIGPSTYANLKSLITVTVVAGAQPKAPQNSSNTKQTKGVPAGYTQTSFAVTNINDPVHADTGVSAPTAASELAAVGAVVPTDTTPTSGAGLLYSPWTLAFLALVLLAGGIFMIL